MPLSALDLQRFTDTGRLWLRNVLPADALER